MKGQLKIKNYWHGAAILRTRAASGGASGHPERIGIIKPGVDASAATLGKHRNGFHQP